MKTLSPITIRVLQGCAVGDAFGASFEYNEKAAELAGLSLRNQEYLTWEAAEQQPNRARIAGCYTDDTQQALILLYAWLNTDQDPLLTPGREEAILFRDICKNMATVPIPDANFGSHRGTGKNFREAISTGQAIDTAGIGAAMRIGPVASLFDDPQEMLDWVIRVSEVTTSNPISLAVAARFAYLIWKLSHPENTQKVIWPGYIPEEIWNLTSQALKILKEQGQEALLAFAQPYSNRPLTSVADGFALTGFAWAVYTGLRAKTFEEALLTATGIGGDTDTIGAMVGCVAACRFPIPQWMVDGLYTPVKDIVLDPGKWNWLLETPITQAEMNLRQVAISEAQEGIDFLSMNQTPKPILFGSPKDPKQYACFSNFAVSPIHLDGHSWLTVEHYFQAMKSSDPDYHARIRKDPSPAAAKKAGRKCYCRSDWDDVKYGIMYKAVKAKFQQNPAMARLLLSTGDTILHENRPDPWWGGGPNYPQGKDWLGQVLMQVRRELKDGT